MRAIAARNRRGITRSGYHAVYCLIASLVTTVLLSACATTPSSGKGSHSHALQVASSAGIYQGLKDVPADTLGIDPNYRTDSKVPGVTVASGYAFQISDAGRISRNAAALSVMTMEFLAPKAPAHHNWAFGWMPDSKAASAGEAKQIFMEIISDALRNELPDGIEMDNRKIGFFYELSGHNCAEIQCKLYSYSFGHSQTNPKLMDAPHFIEGNGKVYGWKDSNWTKLYRFGVDFKGSSPDFDVLEYYQRVSEVLPDWAYLYVAPKPGVSNIPMIMNQGLVYLFINPE